MLEPDRLRAQMIKNAAEINRLHQLIQQDFGAHPNGDSLYEEWVEARKHFHSRYSQLCLPGGWDESFAERLKSGESRAVEAALCFLEVRPYFFRSGYMWKDLLRKCKRAPMSAEQAERFSTLLSRYERWKQDREERRLRGAKVRNEIEALLRQFDWQFPISFQDDDLDGIKTVGDLNVLICEKLEIEPNPMPEKTSGKARKRFSPGRKLRAPLLALITSPSHNAGNWDAPDIWATIVACVREAYKIDEAILITSSTTLRELIRV